MLMSLQMVLKAKQAGKDVQESKIMAMLRRTEEEKEMK